MKNKNNKVVDNGGLEESASSANADPHEKFRDNSASSTNPKNLETNTETISDTMESSQFVADSFERLEESIAVQNSPRVSNLDVNLDKPSGLNPLKFGSYFEWEDADRRRVMLEEQELNLKRNTTNQSVSKDAGVDKNNNSMEGSKTVSYAKMVTGQNNEKKI